MVLRPTDLKTYLFQNNLNKIGDVNYLSVTSTVTLKHLKKIIL